MKILVTGASGFVGRHLATTLARRYPLAVLIQCGDTPGHIPLDLTDGTATERLVAEVLPDACIHLAAIAAIGVARAEPDRAWRVNLGGTLALARAIMAHAPHCRLTFASSADCYGASFRAGITLDESHPLAPLNTYAATKAAADLALGAMAAEGLRAVRLRAFNHTGPGQSPDFVVPAFARQVARMAVGLQPPQMQVGDLTPLRDFLDVRDVCAAYAASIDPSIDLPPGLILNIASGRPIRIGDMLHDLMARAGVEADIVADPARLRPTDIPLAAGDATAARRILGWSPVIDWSTTLDDVLADWRQRL